MSEPIYTQFTERMYSRLPEVMREADQLNGYALKHYISAIGDVEDQVERLIARFTYLTKEERLGLDKLNDDHSYYDLDWRYFQATDSKNSAVITSEGEPAFLRTVDMYHVVPNTELYVGAIYRTDNQDVNNTFGLRLWYYNASMELMSFKDVATANGSTGPQWIIRSATDNVPDEALAVRVSPYVHNTSGVASRVWVDDVYARSNYEVTSTNNLVSSDHNFILRAEDEMVGQGDFDAATEAQWEADRLRVEAQSAYENAPNHFPQGGFENPDDFPHIATTTEYARSGLRSWEVFVDGTTLGREIYGDPVPVTPGQTWRFSLYYRTRSPNTFRINGGLRLQSREFLDSGSWGVANTETGLHSIEEDRSPDGWTLLTGDYTVPENVGAIRVRSAFASTEDTYVWVDDISLQDITPALDLEAKATEAQARADLATWDLGPQVNLADHALDLVPDIQSYRTWLNLDSDTAEPAYARQVVDEVISNATYTISTLMVKDASVPDTAEVRVTVTPDTGGPTVQTFMMSDYETNRPTLLSFVWNSPEQVSTAIVNIEYMADAPARGMRINDVSMTRYQPSLAQMDRDGEPTTLSVQEKTSQELLAGTQPRGEGWTRYETGTDPEVPLEPSTPDPASGTSFIEDGWHQTRPGNKYNLRGEYHSSGAGAYADVIIWYRIEGKGWGEALLHRIASDTLHNWVSFDREIVIPDSATEFRVNIDVYRPDSTKTYDLRNLSLTSPVDRSWWVAGSRPFSFNALATRSLDFLSRDDLVHYTAKVLVTGDTSGGRGGVRVYGNGSQVIHETLIRSVEKNTLLQVTGSFQVPESLADLRVALYMNDPTPKHQAAYFLSDLDVVHSIQQYVEDPQSMVRNGGFEYANHLEDWKLLAEREQVRRNLAPNPISPSATSAVGWRGTSDGPTLVQDAGMPALRIIEDGASSGLYVDPDKNYVIPVGSTVRFAAEVKVTTDVDNMRLVIAQYSGAARTDGSTGWVPQKVTDGWVLYETWATIDAMPEGGFFRCLIWPANGAFATGQGFMVRNVIIEVGTEGDFFDSTFEDTALVRYTYDADTQTHIEHRKNYYAPVGQTIVATKGVGYNKEDVPPRPEGVDLGFTSDLVDPRTANTEWLPWLAQFAGQNINHFSTMEDARTTMAAGGNFAAGTIDAISAAVATVLSNTKTVRIFPHTAVLTQVGKATEWDVSIVTRTSESPDISVMEEAVRLRNAKPAGVRFHFHKHQSTWDAVELAYPEWNDWDERNWTQIEEAGLEG